jgi:hypothetical protein
MKSLEDFKTLELTNEEMMDIKGGINFPYIDWCGVSHAAYNIAMDNWDAEGAAWAMSWSLDVC